MNGPKENLRGVQLSYLNKFLHRDLPARHNGADKLFEFVDGHSEIKSPQNEIFEVKKGTTCIIRGGNTNQPRMFCQSLQKFFTLVDNNLELNKDIIERRVQDWTMQDVWDLLWRDRLSDAKNGTCYLDDLQGPGALRFISSEEKKCAYLICSREAKYERVVCALYRHVQTKEIRVHEEDYYVWVDIFCSRVRQRDLKYGVNSVDLMPNNLGLRSEEIIAASESAANTLDGYNQEQVLHLFQELDVQCEEMKAFLPEFLERLVFVDSFQKPNVLTRSWCVWELYCATRNSGRISVVHPGPIRFQDKVATDFDGIYTIINSLNPLDFRSMNEVDLKLMFRKFVTLEGGFLEVTSAIQNAFTSWLTLQMRSSVYNFPATQTSKLTYIEALLACAFLGIQRALTSTQSGSAAQVAKNSQGFLHDAINAIYEADQYNRHKKELLWKKGVAKLGEVLLKQYNVMDPSPTVAEIQTEIFPKMPKTKERLDLEIQLHLALKKYQLALNIRESEEYQTAGYEFEVNASAFMAVAPLEEIIFMNVKATFQEKDKELECDKLINQLNRSIDIVSAKIETLKTVPAGPTDTEAAEYELQTTALRFHQRKYMAFKGMILYYQKNYEAAFEFMDKNFFDENLLKVERGNLAVRDVSNEEWVSKVLPTRRIGSGYGKRIFQIAVLTYSSARRAKCRSDLEDILLDEVCETGRCFYGWKPVGQDMVKQELSTLLFADAEMRNEIYDEIYISLTPEEKETWIK